MRRPARLRILALAALVATAPLPAAAHDTRAREDDKGRQGATSRDDEPAHHRRDPLVACSVADIVSDSNPRRRHGFRATRILGLEFHTELIGRLERERTLELRLYTPEGFLYQVLEVEVEVEQAGRRRQRLQARLPVAGTSIMASGLYGRWKVVPYLDGARKPCGPARPFTIRP